MTSNPAKPQSLRFKSQSLWNRWTKKNIYSGRVELEEVAEYLDTVEEGNSFLINDGRINYCSHPRKVETGEIEEYLEEFNDYDDVAGYSEVHRSELGYHLFVSLAPGNNGDGEMNYSKEEGIKIKGTAGREPGWI